MEILKPCPFCGGSAEYYPSRDSHAVTCTVCKASILRVSWLSADSDYGGDDPIGVWNRRSTEQPNQAFSEPVIGHDGVTWWSKDQPVDDTENHLVSVYATPKLAEAYAQGYLTGARHKAQHEREAGLQPIETAPKDETEILVWDSYYECFTTAWWSRRDERWIGPGDHDPTPSHWMSLPQPPENCRRGRDNAKEDS